MGFIVLAACCSVLVSVLLKVLKSKGFEPLQLIVWNYVSASLLCFYGFSQILRICLFNTRRGG